MRLTLNSARAQRILEVLNDNLERGPEAPTFSIQLGFQMAGAITGAGPGTVGMLLAGLEDYLQSLSPEFPVVLDVTLYANTPTTAKLVTAVETELKAMAAKEQGK